MRKRREEEEEGKKVRERRKSFAATKALISQLFQSSWINFASRLPGD